MAAKHQLLSLTARIDLAGELQTQIKPLDKELKDLKGQIRNIMTSDLKDSVEAVDYEAVLSGGSTSVIDAYQLYLLLKEKGELAKFWHCISVKVKDAKEGLADVVTLSEFDGLKEQVETTKRLSIKAK